MTWFFPLTIIWCTLVAAYYGYWLKKKNNYTDEEFKRVRELLVKLVGGFNAAILLVWIIQLVGGLNSPFYFYSNDYSNNYVILGQSIFGIFYAFVLYFLWFTKVLDEMLMFNMLGNMPKHPLILRLFVTACIVGTSYMVVSGNLSIPAKMM